MLDDTRRYYPEDTLASQVLGTVGDRQQRPVRARAGSSTSDLRGSDGEQRIVRDARGEPVSLDQKSEANASGKTCG